MKVKREWKSVVSKMVNQKPTMTNGQIKFAPTTRSKSPSKQRYFRIVGFYSLSFFSCWQAYFNLKDIECKINLFWYYNNIPFFVKSGRMAYKPKLYSTWVGVSRSWAFPLQFGSNEILFSLIVDWEDCVQDLVTTVGWGTVVNWLLGTVELAKWAFAKTKSCHTLFMVYNLELMKRSCYERPHWPLEHEHCSAIQA